MFGTSQNTHVVSEGEGLDSVLIWHEHHISGKHKQCRVILRKSYTLAFGLMTVSKSSFCPWQRGILWGILSSFDSFLLGRPRNFCLWTNFWAVGHEHSEAELEVPCLGLQEWHGSGSVFGWIWPMVGPGAAPRLNYCLWRARPPMGNSQAPVNGSSGIG